jgi:hypothetical protein
MHKLETELLTIGTPVIAALLSAAFPAVSPLVFSILLNGLRTGAIDSAAIEAFCAEHNLHAYADYDIKKNDPFVSTTEGEQQP